MKASGQKGEDRMGSQKPRVIRLSESAQASNYAALDDELNGGDEARQKKPPSLNLVGSVKEKGFSTEPISFHRITVPQPRVTPFPVARHRSDGPHWGPLPSQAPSFPARQMDGAGNGGEMAAAVLAEPLHRQKAGHSQTSQWRSSRKSDLNISMQTQNAFDDTRLLGNSSETSRRTIEKQSIKVVEVGSEVGDRDGESSHSEQHMGAPSLKNILEEVSKDARQSDATAVVKVRQAQGRVLEILEKPVLDPVIMQRRPASVERSNLGGEYSMPAKQATQLGLDTLRDQEIDAEARNALFAMSAEQVAEAQAELTQKMPPELLEILRKRGADKERKRLAEKTGAATAVTISERDEGNKKDSIELDTSSSADSHHAETPAAGKQIRSVPKILTGIKSLTIPQDQTASKRMEAVRGTGVGPADLLPAAAQEEMPSDGKPEERTPPPATTDPWTLRVEAVRSMRFDLDGSIVSVGPAPQIEEASQSNGAAGVVADSEHKVLTVVERDYLRTDGDPVGTGYSLKDALALVRSTVPGQRAVALRLVSSVLDKAIHGLQNQKSNQSTAIHSEGVGGPADWQAVWAYALGPEAELVLTLRLALDDGHTTVVAACARAIQALLSFSANETYFDTLGALWPGDEVVHTAPVFRRKTNLNEGFIGGGRWKYNVKTSEMKTGGDPEKTEEEGKDTVADDGHISNKDVAAGLIRMGVLPRIRYILEVDKHVAAEEALLSVLICMARHSPTAANKVMKCPRLVDAILQRFVGTEGRLSEEAWSARLKAIRLLKVLSQANRSNCVHFEGTGTLETVMRPLLQQRYVNQPQGHAHHLDQGYYEIMIETLRFWRVCIDYGIGISLFSDCYPTLCFWLLPSSKEEIHRVGKDEPLLLLLAMESYLLLEHIARTLPLLHATGEPPALAGQPDLVNWSWGVAQALLDTAMKWLSAECISGIHALLEQYLSACGKPSQETFVLKSSTRRVLGIEAAVLHFLATVCGKIVSEKELQCALDDPNNSSIPWLPTFLPQLGLVLAKSGLLNYSRVGVQSDSPVPSPESDLAVPALESDVPLPTLKKKHTFMDCLHFCQRQADPDFALVAINCVNALVRVSSIIDKLIHIARRKAISSPVAQTLAHKVLMHGLLPSAEVEFRNLLVLCKENVSLRNDLMQMSVRGGPAPGVGIGWGSFCGGAWSKEVMIAQASARVALNLISVFSSTLWLNHQQNESERVIQEGKPSKELSWETSWRFNFGLAVVATSTTVNRDLVHQVNSRIIFHPSTLPLLIQKIEEALVSWRSKRAQEDGFQIESRPADDQNLNPEYLSKVLCQHHESFWLTAKKRKDKEEVGHNVSFKRKKKVHWSDLAAVDEECSDDYVSHPQSLMREWVGQRLPLPSHWLLSPMVVDLLHTSKQDWESGVDSKSEHIARLEEVIKAGLAFFLGFELLAASTSQADAISADIPLVRKIHSLSTVFVSGGDLFLHPHVRDLIGALQSLLGNQIAVQSRHLPHQSSEGKTASEDIQRGVQNGSDEHGYQAITVVGDEATSENLKDSGSILAVKGPLLDFEGSIDASYLKYAETIAEQFVATSYGDHGFARQVALYLCLEVHDTIRLATWRVLTDGRVLELLPPLNQCCGPPRIYLYPIETNQQMLEFFLSTWSSGALDKAAKRNSLPFTLVLHHLAAYVFDTADTEENLLSKKKFIRVLVRSTVRKLHRQEMLSRLVHYVPAWPSSNSEQTSEEAETNLTGQPNLRLLLLLKACKGDGSLTTEVQNLQKLLGSRE